MSDHTFSRLHLAETMKEVRKHVSKEEIKAAWTYKYTWGKRSGPYDCEFHGPNNFYHSTRCYNLWDCRAEGWIAYLRYELKVY